MSTVVDGCIGLLTSSNIFSPHTSIISNFRKRYDKAEKEFVTAKLKLHEASERKESLTEHLCKIIEINETRKAEKLTKLMVELNIAPEQSSPVGQQTAENSNA